LPVNVTPVIPQGGYGSGGGDIEDGDNREMVSAYWSFAREYVTLDDVVC